MGLHERGCPYLGYASQTTQNRSHILLETDFESLAAHFILGLGAHMRCLSETSWITAAALAIRRTVCLCGRGDLPIVVVLHEVEELRKFGDMMNE